MKPITGPCFLILTEGSYTTPGDERSRTNPGHGYPASTEYYTEVEVVTTLEELKSKIERMSTSRYSKAFQFGEFKPMKVETNITLKGLDYGQA